MDYFKLKGHKVSITASYPECLVIDHTLTKDQYRALTGKDADTGKPVKVVFKKSEKKKIKDKSEKIDQEDK